MRFSKGLISAAMSAVMLSAIACSPAQEEHKIAVAAHRGFWNCEEAGYAQNSIKALALAQENHFWGSEFDVQLTSDDIPIVNHNSDIDGVLIWDHPFSAFEEARLKNGESIPTLDDYLAQGEKCATTMLVFELKAQMNQDREETLVQLSLQALKDHNLYDPSRVMFITFSHYMCQRIAVLAPEFTNQYLESDICPDDLAKEGINGVDYHYSTFTAHPEWYDQARNNNMSINVWTVNSSEDQQAMIDLGVDCITTNEPLLTRELLGEKENLIVVKKKRK